MFYVITFGLAKSDHIKRLLLHFNFIDINYSRTWLLKTHLDPALLVRYDCYSLWPWWFMYKKAQLNFYVITELKQWIDLFSDAFSKPTLKSYILFLLWTFSNKKNLTQKNIHAQENRFEQTFNAISVFSKNGLFLFRTSHRL